MGGVVLKNILENLGIIFGIITSMCALLYCLIFNPWLFTCEMIFSNFYHYFNGYAPLIMALSIPGFIISLFIKKGKRKIISIALNVFSIIVGYYYFFLFSGGTLCG